MSSSPPAKPEEDVFDLTEAVPETERLDSSLLKARAQLSFRRHRPSRSRPRDSLSSTEGDDGFDRKALQSESSPLHRSISPLHSSLHRASPSSDLLLSSSPVQRDRAHTLDSRSELEAQERRHRNLLNTSSGTALLLSPTCSPSRSCSRSETSSPAHLQRVDPCPSEDDGREAGTDEPGSPTVLLDKKTRRRFLDLGVTLRRTYGKVRRDRSNRLSAGNREAERVEGRSSRSSGPPFVPFSWFSDRIRGSSSSASQPSVKAQVQGSTIDGISQSSQPYENLTDYSDEGCDSSGCGGVS